MTDELDFKFPHKVLFFRACHEKDKCQLENLKASADVVFVYDEIERQIKELIRCRYPMGLSVSEEEIQIQNLLNGKSMSDYGVWVYYPWRKSLVHLLDEEEFIEVRTNRNQLKISVEEQQLLSRKKIGVIGLSVGQSIALTIAMERICGVLRLADFDTLDLSNMNRLRTGVFNLAVPKVVIAAREIAEIDPYLKVELFPKGVDSDNYDDFLLENGGVDMLVEVCDSFDVKLESRFRAREAKIPVVMDTNDRGMLDIERFDMEPSRAVFHGLADDLTLDRLKTLTADERRGYLMKIVDAHNLSLKMKKSIPEIGKTIISWPQLASEVVLGGAVTTTVCRGILLGHSVASGRYYLDVEKTVGISN
ncbi:ThiF family adenylyltransferase [Sphingobacterium faecale]|uniref:ThiF family adenylyltransferase n=1 Tax=Sphingobacterium faecale TaxID=2803775 RepID=A0ABS1R0E7_9SPHI|nr:ThiF family adenylyltransferase [Sphingobacterium faecale]MBL1408163.1 ThiF family adenylyltransferase [Sphingobacterium faecale]